MRLFIAVPVPEDVRRVLSNLREEISGARWVPPEQYHITLRFLGETAVEQLPALSGMLAAVRGPILTLRSLGLTTFPDRRQPRVLVVRLAPEERLAALHAGVEAAVRRLGFLPENRPFRPHLTLARLRDADPEVVWRFTRDHKPGVAFTADHFALYASTLTPAGAVHERLATFPLVDSGERFIDRR